MTELEIKNALLALIRQAKPDAPVEIDTTVKFSDLGLDSLDLVALSGELEELLDIVLDPIIAYTYNSIDLLAQHLAEPEQVPAL